MNTASSNPPDNGLRKGPSMPGVCPVTQLRISDHHARVVADNQKKRPRGSYKPEAMTSRDWRGE